MRKLFLALVITAWPFAAMATTSIVAKATGSALTFDVCQDSVTTNQRSCGYLLDPVTALPASPFQSGGTVVVSSAPNPACTVNIPINQTTSTDVHTFTNIGYICSIVLVSGSAQNISVIEGTGTLCATGTTALVGGTTASMATAANSGFSAVAGIPWLKMNASADHLCILQSSGGNISGVITAADHT